jgi:hypothetical protein
MRTTLTHEQISEFLAEINEIHDLVHEALNLLYIVEKIDNDPMPFISSVACSIYLKSEHLSRRLIDVVPLNPPGVMEHCEVVKGVIEDGEVAGLSSRPDRPDSQPPNTAA